jgi:hypothetical protein
MAQQQDILRRYLDILKEADASAPQSTQPTDPQQLDTPATDNASAKMDPIETAAGKVISAVKDFQKIISSVSGKFPQNAPERRIQTNGMIDPPTLAAIYSHGGRGIAGAADLQKSLSTPSDADAGAMNEDDMGSTAPNPMTAPTQSPGGTPPASAPMTETIQDTLRRKAALHEGYSCGLMAESHHNCTHPEGSHEHLHYMHGYGKGLAECSGVWGMKGTY